MAIPLQQKPTRVDVAWVTDELQEPLRVDFRKQFHYRVSTIEYPLLRRFSS